jgi:type II secretory pathway pseudopilin PulG
MSRLKLERKYKSNTIENDPGFTIIETMFVLAIASFIFLLTFEAIPALNRTSQNSVRKHDASIALNSVSNHILNNSGNIPNCNNGEGSPSCTVYYSGLNFGYYTTSELEVDTLTVPQNISSSSPLLNQNNILISNYLACETPGSADLAVTGAGLGFDDVVAIYAIKTDTSGGYEYQCTSLNNTPPPRQPS